MVWSSHYLAWSYEWAAYPVPDPLATRARAEEAVQREGDAPRTNMQEWQSAPRAST